MNKASAKYLQAVIVLVGIGALAFLLWEPHLEGRNAHATLFEIYFKDPFLAYVYVGSIPFFVALHKSFRVLGYAAQRKTSTQPTLKALRTIKYCGMTLVCFVSGAAVYIMLNESDDRAGGIFMCLLAAFVSLSAAAGAAMLERVLRRENTAD